MVIYMKRLVALSLLAGYIMLVPFCFFGGALMVSGGAMNMDMNMIGSSAHSMGDCGMSLGGCVHAAGIGDPIAHHVSMYNSITQTPLTALTLMMAVLVVAFAASFYLVFGSLPALLARTSLRHPPQRTSEPQSGIKQRILSWLSLFETSPNFA